MPVCTSLQTDNHASTPPLSFFTGWMPFLPPNQQRQSTEGLIIGLRENLRAFSVLNFTVIGASHRPFDEPETTNLA